MIAFHKECVSYVAISEAFAPFSSSEARLEIFEMDQLAVANGPGLFPTVVRVLVEVLGIAGAVYFRHERRLQQTTQISVYN